MKLYKAKIIKEEDKDFQTTVRNFVEDFDKISYSQRYIFGINLYTDNVINQYKVAGIIDENTNLKSHEGVDIVKLHEVPKDALILVASGGATQSILKKLTQSNMRALDYFAFQRFNSKKLVQPRFNENFEQEFLRNYSKFEYVQECLADSESRRQFQAVINFRFYANIEHMKGFENRESEQYFEPFLNTNKQIDNFIDVGGFDGFTSQQFISNYPNFREINIFEPETLNYQVCINRFRNFENIFVHKVCLSKESGFATFISSASTSRIDANILGGDISVRPLDSYANLVTNNSYVKVDIEGDEINFLRGSANSIKTHTPFLAIAVYHNSEDLWKIANEVLAMNSNYYLFFRHYTETLYESVLYFVPRT